MTCVFVVGTDTGVGKTAVVAELLVRARALGVRVLPYKPAQSRAPGERADSERLLEAAAWPGLSAAHINPFDYALPLAPGLVDDRARFVQPSACDDGPLRQCRAHLDAAIAAHAPDHVLIEGAGGLWVPMPGGSWQPQWITSLAAATVVVGRAGLGTINHSLCTIDGLRALGREPLGFYLCETVAPDPSCADNAAVIAAARGVPWLGTLPHGRAPAQCLLAPLLAALG